MTLVFLFIFIHGKSTGSSNRWPNENSDESFENETTIPKILVSNKKFIVEYGISIEDNYHIFSDCKCNSHKTNSRILIP